MVYYISQKVQIKDERLEIVKILPKLKSVHDI